MASALPFAATRVLFEMLCPFRCSRHSADLNLEGHGCISGFKARPWTTRSAPQSSSTCGAAACSAQRDHCAVAYTSTICLMF